MILCSIYETGVSCIFEVRKRTVRSLLVLRIEKTDDGCTSLVLHQISSFFLGSQKNRRFGFILLCLKYPIKNQLGIFRKKVNLKFANLYFELKFKKCRA